MKECSRNIEITEFMEMPCQCDCGRWFDLHDGHRRNGQNQLVCLACHDIDEIEEQIKDIEYQMECGDTKKREGKAAIKRLKTKMDSIYFDDDNY